MKEAQLPGLGVIIGLCGLAALLTAFLLAPSAEGVFALTAWAAVGLCLVLGVGLYLGSNVVRIGAVVVFGLFALSDIPVLALGLLQWPNPTKALAPSLGFLVGFAVKVWATWYLTRPAVRDAFRNQHNPVGQTA
jgi:hypothetical protein